MFTFPRDLLLISEYERIKGIAYLHYFIYVGQYGIIIITIIIYRVSNTFIYTFHIYSFQQNYAHIFLMFDRYHILSDVR